MASLEYSDEDISNFLGKLDVFATAELNEQERALLRAILHAASGRPAEAAPEELSFADEFAAAFQQNHAESIVSTYSGNEPASFRAFVVR